MLILCKSLSLSIVMYFLFYSSFLFVIFNGETYCSFFCTGLFTLITYSWFFRLLFYFYFPLLPLFLMPWILFPAFWKSLPLIKSALTKEYDLRFIFCACVPVFVAWGFKNATIVLGVLLGVCFVLFIIKHFKRKEQMLDNFYHWT